MCSLSHGDRCSTHGPGCGACGTRTGGLAWGVRALLASVWRHEGVVLRGGCGPNTIGPGRACRLLGAGRTITPSLCMASMVTLAIMSLRPPSGLSQPVRRQNSLAKAARVGGGLAAIRVRSSANKPALPPFPQIQNNISGSALIRDQSTHRPSSSYTIAAPAQLLP